jgi:hypothetical protein
MNSQHFIERLMFALLHCVIIAFIAFATTLMTYDTIEVPLRTHLLVVTLLSVTLDIIACGLSKLYAIERCWSLSYIAQSFISAALGAVAAAQLLD